MLPPHLETRNLTPDPLTWALACTLRSDRSQQSAWHLTGHTQGLAPVTCQESPMQPSSPRILAISMRRLATVGPVLQKLEHRGE